MTDPTPSLIAELIARGLTIAVAESLTGGLLTAALIQPAGASATVLGGIVAYTPELKVSLLGVSPAAVAAAGAVNSTVAEQMASNVREFLAVNGRPADIGLATTGVAGPGDNAGVPAGVVYLGLSHASGTTSQRCEFRGTRDDVRGRAVEAAVSWLASLYSAQ